MEWLIRKETTDEYGILKLQNVILNIMHDIDTLCRNNDIDYYIIGGTALGAVRHGGFIPWDDDLDIAMTRKNYDKFIQVCRNQLDKKRYYFQEEVIDWPLYFSKIRLKGTYVDEYEGDISINKENRGVWVDIFPLDNVPDNKFYSCWWYICSKILIAYTLNKRGYNSATCIKKIAMSLSFPLKLNCIRHFFEHQIKRYNNKKTKFIGGASMISRFHNAFVKSDVLGTPKNISFETIELMAPQDIHVFLKFYFGDYMKLPPIKARYGKHLINVDLGIYE